MFEPKTLAPLPDSQVATRLERSGATAKLSTFIAPLGALSEPGLAADLAACGNRLSWLRPSVFDLHPSPAQRQSGRTGGATVVVDASHGASDSPRFLPYLFDLASRPGAGDVMVLSDRAILPALPSSVVTQPNTAELLHSSSLDRIAAPAQARLLDLASDRPGLIPAFAKPLWHLGVERFEWTVLAAATMSELVGNIVSLYLSRSSPTHIAALEAACLLGYAHDSFASLRPVSPMAATEPWWEPLGRGWLRLSPVWRPTLAQQCMGRAPSSRRVQADLVDQLVSRGAVCEAIDAQVTIGAFDSAAKLIHREADFLILNGHYDVLNTWLDKIPLDDVRKGRRLHKLHAACKARAEIARLEAPGCPPAALVHKQVQLVPAFGYAHSVALPPRIEPAAQESEPAGGRRVSIDLLGPLRVVVDEVAVKRWTGATGRNLLRYIAAQHPRAVSAERLQETFWPDVPPRTSKNRLHVALHTLRADLRRFGLDDIVEFRDGAYRLADGLEIAVDTTQFAALLDKSVGEAEPARVISLLESARGIYRGDFLDDSPYENWATLEREMWKVRHLGLLERLAHTYFVLGSYRQCIAVSQELIAKDLCRDDIHRLVMRSFARLDQPHLAMRQFELCRAQLLADLGKQPAVDLVELRRRIQLRESV